MFVNPRVWGEEDPELADGVGGVIKEVWKGWHLEVFFVLVSFDLLQDYRHLDQVRPVPRRSLSWEQEIANLKDVISVGG